MNGIIHPCCHPEDKPAPTSEDEMFVEIFKYIDRIMAMIRPRKVLYMAIDGVAPRAKMNQQRSRRFRAAQEDQEKLAEEERLRQEWSALGDTLPEKLKKEHFDSNCITPGTPFMANLAVCLRYYVADRLQTDPGWRNLKVILSDATVPGEGEHKIMDYIRRQRTAPGYDPNTQHCLYGLDADLIMLALATHEPHFKILREDVFFNEGSRNNCFICNQPGHMAAQCTGKPKEKDGEFDEKEKGLAEKPFVFLHVNILREYLEAELQIEVPHGWDLERAIDDWVFLCFFVGNDFLPHLPSLEIREGAIDKLIEIWKRNGPTWGGYLTENGAIDMQRVQMVMTELGKLEDEVFRHRRESEQRRREGRIRRARELKERQQGFRGGWNGAPPPVQYPQMNPEIANAMQAPLPVVAPTLDANKAAADALRNSLQTESTSATSPTSGVKRKAEEAVDEAAAAVEETAATGETLDDTIEIDGDDDAIEVDDDEEVEETLTVAEVPVPHPKPKPADDDEEAEPEDNVRLWEDGWKQRYYNNKFHVEETDVAFKRRIVTSYVEGLCWVLKYYYQGCQSWHWYYPYHYSPFASDFDFIGELDIKFDLGEPFKPVEQLMGVLPARSRQHIPPVFHALMTDPDSEIIDFYPEKFPLDLNGKKYAWQGVALLPFIDQDRLLKAIHPLYPKMTEDEVARNTKGDEILVVGGTHTLFEQFCRLFGKKALKEPVPIDPRLSQWMMGSVLPDPNACVPGSTFESPLSHLGLPDIQNNQSLSVLYFMPKMEPGYIFKARLLEKVSLPDKVLNYTDVYNVKMGYNAGGRRGRGGYRGGGRGSPNDASRMELEHKAIAVATKASVDVTMTAAHRSETRALQIRLDTWEVVDTIPTAAVVTMGAKEVVDIKAEMDIRVDIREAIREAIRVVLRVEVVMEAEEVVIRVAAEVVIRVVAEVAISQITVVGIRMVAGIKVATKETTAITRAGRPLRTVADTPPIPTMASNRAAITAARLPTSLERTTSTVVRQQTLLGQVADLPEATVNPPEIWGGAGMWHPAEEELDSQEAAVPGAIVDVVAAVRRTEAGGNSNPIRVGFLCPRT
ncbi:5'-3' exoribonuclease 2 [Borealophlyctis nickersoniae]|nr:5'-3' exoribonuclease 2 [Borealophlyctis nickersoniae]